MRFFNPTPRPKKTVFEEVECIFSENTEVATDGDLLKITIYNCITDELSLEELCRVFSFEITRTERYADSRVNIYWMRKK